MADEINSGNDLDIKLGVTIEDYATVAAKIDDILKKLQNDKNFTLKVDFKDANKSINDTAKNMSKIKTEFNDIGRGFKSISKAMKEMYQTDNNSVTTTTKGGKKYVDEFTVSIAKAGDEIENLTYKWNKAKEGFVFSGKQVVDKSSINDSILANKLAVLNKDYNTKFNSLNRTTNNEILNAPLIKSQIDDIQKRLKDLNKMKLDDANQEIKLLSKDFAQLKEDIASAKIAYKELNNEKNSNNGISLKSEELNSEKDEVTNLSREYNKLYKEMNNLYGDQGDISIISNGELNKIDSFTLKIKESEASMRELKYVWNEEENNGFILTSIKNIDKRQEAATNALKKVEETRKENEAKQKKDDNDEIERINKINNLKLDYAIKIQNAMRSYGSLMENEDISKELEEFKTALNTLDGTPLDNMTQKTKELSLGWKQLGANIKDQAAVMKNQQYETWIDSITRKTKEFFTWYLSANAVMQSKNFLMDSIRQINEMDEATVELTKVADLSSTALNNMSSSAIDLAKSLGKVNPSEVMLSMAEFGRVTKVAEEIEELAKTATVASNVTTFNAEEAAKAINTTVLSMNMDLKDGMTILDQFNEIQNNYRTNAEDLAASIGEVGAIANQTGTSLARLNGYTTALVASTGMSGSEAGTAQKSFMSRIFRVGSEGEDDAGDAEKALDSVKISVRDVVGEFRNYDDIMDEIHSKWDGWSKATQTYIAQTVGG